MARKVLTNLDLNLNQILNFKAELLASDPGSPQEGQVWHNTTDNRLRYYDGSTVRTCGEGAAADALVFKGVVDGSANPDYPAADAGDTYKISVAGKIGGASGPDVEVGDMAICTVDSTATGDHATVGANWVILQTNIDQATTTVVGFTRYSTSAEAQAGVVTDAAVTPAALASTGAIKKYAADITAASSGTITAGTHNLGATKNLVVQIYEDGAPNSQLIADISVADNGDVSWATVGNITGHIVIVG